MMTREPVPAGWYEQLADECRTNGIQVGVNSYGALVSMHTCVTCGRSYTVCPPSPNEGDVCLRPDCGSYDPSRDATYLFAPDDPALIEGDR